MIYIISMFNYRNGYELGIADDELQINSFDWLKNKIQALNFRKYEKFHTLFQTHKSSLSVNKLHSGLHAYCLLLATGTALHIAHCIKTMHSNI